MSLVATSCGFTPVRGAIYFPMQRGKHVITCAHTRAGMAKIFGSDPARLDMAAIFTANRSIFEHLAQTLYDTDCPSV
jgi:Protein of unknown function (DUF1488)